MAANTPETQSGFHYENFKRRSRYTIVFLILAIAFCVIIFLNINIGSTPISPAEIVKILIKGADAAKDNTDYNIIWKIRLPRIFMAALLGGALSLAGFLLQTFFSNPIAGPFVLGISHGAKMMVALTMVVFMQYFSSASSVALIVAAFIGAMISVVFILLISKRIHHMAILLVAGIMIGYICSAVTDFVVTFAEDSDIVNLRSWSQGSFSGMTWGNVKLTVMIVGVGLVLSFLLSKPISAYQLGEAYAQSMGVNIKFFRVALILISSILAACVTAFAGPISFVGIAVPHLVKMGLKTSKPIVVIPGVFLGGAVFCMFCDLIARMAFSPLELNISTVTSIFGAPIVITMLLSRQKGKM